MAARCVPVTPAFTPRTLWIGADRRNTSCSRRPGRPNEETTAVGIGTSEPLGIAVKLATDATTSWP